MNLMQTVAWVKAARGDGNSGGSGGGGFNYEMPKSLFPTFVGENAFLGNKSLKAVKLLGVEIVAERAFLGCGVERVELHRADTSLEIQVEAFNGCKSLTDVILENAFVENEAFSECTALERVSGNFGVTDWAFRGCTNLKEVHGLAALNSTSFSGCCSLEIVVMHGSHLPDYAFSDSPNLGILVLNSHVMCNVSVLGIIGTKILNSEGLPTGEGHIYVPTDLYEQYIAQFVEQGTALTGDAATAEYIARAILRKIEDYPEICGTAT